MPTTKPVWKDDQYATTAKLTSRSLIAAFRPDKNNEAEQRNLFFAGETTPHFVYPKLEATIYDATVIGLESRLDDWDDDSPLGRIYLRILRENLLVNDMADAAKKGNMKGFKRINEALGFVPDWKLFYSIVADIRRRAEWMLDDVVMRPVAVRMLEALPTASSRWDCLLPSEDQVRAAFPAMLKLCEYLHLPTDVDFDSIWDAQELARVLQASLEEGGAEGWSVIVTDEQSRISVSRADKQAKIPAKRRLHGRDAYAVIAHERLHIERALRGGASGYYFLQTGTAGYIVGEEGVTLALEQALKGRADRHAREDYYLAIAAANGFIGGHFMTFEQVYQLMRTYYEFVAVEPDREADPTESPEERAWAQTLRTFRGTNCQGNGVFYGKDVVYAQGNLGIWQLLIERPEMAQTFMLGKFNPLNRDDVRDLTDLGLLAV